MYDTLDRCFVRDWNVEGKTRTTYEETGKGENPLETGPAAAYLGVFRVKSTTLNSISLRR